MAIQKYIDRLKFFIKNVSSQEKKQKKYLNLLYALKNLESSKDGEKISKVISALQYLEDFVFDKFTPQTFFNRKKNLNDFSNIISDKEQDQIVINVFNDLLSIAKLQQECNKSPWLHHYEYPVDHKREVINSVTRGDWYHEMVSLKSNKNAYLDYVRDSSIEGMTKMGHSPEEIDVILTNFIKKAMQINKTSSKKNDHLQDFELLHNWLANNGGQFTNRFFIHAIRKGHFSKVMDEPYNPKLLEQHWYINHAGKICMALDILIYGLLRNSERDEFFIVKTRCDSLGERISLDDLVELHDKLLPVMRMKATLELVIEKENGRKFVRPKVTAWQATSYSKYLARTDVDQPEKNINDIRYQTFIRNSI